MSVPALSSYLQARLGQKQAARLAGLSDARQIGRYRSVDGPRPRPGVELRMREAVKLVATIEAAFDGEVAGAWLTGTNARLGDRAPIEVLGEAETPAEFARLRAAARSFVLSEATVRDPLSDRDAVLAARARPMSERLEVALSWNLVASELQIGLVGSGYKPL